MITTIDQWGAWLQRADALVGLPFCAVGVVFALGGWRLWKIAVVLTFGLIGGAVGVHLAGSSEDQLLYCAVGALGVGLASLPPANYSVAVLGGLIGGGLSALALSALGLEEWPLWIAAGLLFGVCTAMSYVHLRHVIIIITAFEGAVLIVSGLVALLAGSPTFNFFQSICSRYAFFLPFLLIVPTVMGCMLQMSDVRQRDSGMVGR